MTNETTTDAGATSGAPLSGERADLLDTLRKHRFFLTFPARDLTDEQAAATPTVSALCIGGLVKHVARTEASWAAFMQGDTSALGGSDEAGYVEHANSFRMLEGETLAGLLAEYARVAAATDALVATIDLDASTPLPPAPWFEPGARWTARRVLLHIVAETAQHAGHADIVREAIDGAKSMG
ncbi:DinB family protein [Kineosporia sp. R_H_3]|uniref:DinB family protein n=1 Tax=Kineosporia sp. R_H_3 TaxID=1961848 RepID=UPI000B4BAD75|nr:DinB family protein [Kineosporia sp. R_H_3]